MYIIDTSVNEKSVTNDVENVVQYLSENNSLKNRRLFYKDSAGVIDEILHNNEKFTDFAPGYKGIEFI